MQLISNEVKALCLKNLTVAEGGERLGDDYEWETLWDDMKEVGNIFEKIYMSVMGRRAYKTRLKAKIMMGVVSGFSDKKKPKPLAKATKPLAQNPYANANAEANPFEEYYNKLVKEKYKKAMGKADEYTQKKAYINKLGDF